MATLQVSGLVKSYGGVTAVDGVSFHVETGQLAVLVGPSGCGKTTLLRLIAGLEKPDRGEIHLDGKDLAPIRPHARGVTMVFQTPALYPHLTVRKNLEYPLRLQRLARDEIARRLDHAGPLLKIAPLLDRRPDQLSGGEQQRVALGKALIQQPHIWLMDEPLASLDAPLRRELGREIQSLQRQLGTTTLFVTHDQSEALAYGDWLIVMRDGRVQQMGTPQEVYARPASRFVATFLGDPPMNLLRVEVRHGRFQIGRSSVGVPRGTVDGLVDLGIRPEDVQLIDEADAAGVQAQVKRIEFRGHAAFLDVECAGQTLCVRTGPRTTLEPGTRLNLGMPPECWHFFEATADGLRLDHESPPP